MSIGAGGNALQSALKKYAPQNIAHSKYPSRSRDIDIVDAQVHIWAADTPQRPWPPGRRKPHRPVPFSADDLLREMDAAGVRRAVIVPPSWEGDRNDLGMETARLHPDRCAVAGRIDVESAGSRGLMARWRGQPGMMALRIGFHKGRFRSMLADGSAEWLWSEAAAAAVPIMLTVDPDQLQVVDDIARRHPQLKLALDHLCMPGGSKDQAAFAGLDQLLAIARRPNVAVKATSLPLHTGDVYPYRSLHPYLRRIHNAYGAQRMFWGSDLTKLPCSYRQGVTMFTEEMSWLTAHDLEWIMGRGLCAWLGWPLN